MPINFKDDLCTRREVADLYKVSVMTVMRWERAGLLRPIRIKRSIRYLQSDVLKLMDMYAPDIQDGSKSKPKTKIGDSK